MRAGDVVVEEKLARINASIDAQAQRLDEISLEGARPAIGEDRNVARSASALEHKAAFDASRAISCYKLTLRFSWPQ